MAAPDWNNVLLLQTSFLGDTVLTLPLIAEIRRRFPVKKLTLLCQPASSELLQDYPAIDQIIIDDKKNADRGWAGLRAKADALKAKGFTLALTPHKSLRSALMLYLAQIPCRIGFRQSKGWFLFHRRVERDPRRHDVERNLSILQAFDVRVEDCQRALDLPVSSMIQIAVNRKLTALGASENQLLIGVNPGSVWPTKRWSAAGFAELIVGLKKQFSCQVLLFGGPEDEMVVEDVQKRCDRAAINLVNQISLRELAAAISRCAVFVTNDSGPMHIAVARKVPTVAIFCATTPELGFYPYTAKAIVVGSGAACRPCAPHGGRRCPLGTADCSEGIHPADVFGAVRRLLNSERCEAKFSAQCFQPEFVTV
jgi:lipopolysaccharide heptosyltransferase II